MKYTNFLIIDLKNKRTATKAMNVMKNRLSNGFACDDHYEDSPSGRMMNELQILNGTMILLAAGNKRIAAIPKAANSEIIPDTFEPVTINTRI